MSVHPSELYERRSVGKVFQGMGDKENKDFFMQLRADFGEDLDAFLVYLAGATLGIPCAE